MSEEADANRKEHQKVKQEQAADCQGSYPSARNEDQRRAELEYHNSELADHTEVRNLQ
jgi:hypothetical protein